MERLDWQDLDDAGRCAALARPPEGSDPGFLGQVREIIATVRREGVGALRGYAREFDHAELGSLQVSEAEFAAAEADAFLKVEDRTGIGHANGDGGP